MTVTSTEQLRDFMNLESAKSAHCSEETHESRPVYRHAPLWDMSDSDHIGRGVPAFVIMNPPWAGALLTENFPEMLDTQ